MGLWAKVRARLFGGDDPASPVAVSPPVETPAERQEGESPSTIADPNVAPIGDADRVAARQERAAGRILDDERLRGDLTDDEYQPLLDWALAMTDRIAASTAGMDDSEADRVIDEGLVAVRGNVGAARAAVVAHAEGDAERRSAELQVIGRNWSRFPTDVIEGVPDEAVASRLRTLSERLDAEPDLPGSEVASSIVEAFRTTTDEPPSAGPAEGRAERRSRSPFTIAAILILIPVVVVLLIWMMRDRIPGLSTIGRPDVATTPAPTLPPVAGGPYEVFFTTPVYPDRPETRRGGIDERFVQFVDSAKRTLDVATYEFDLENVAEAMTRAKSRGVAVRMVTDADTINATRDDATQHALKIVRDAGITIVPDDRSAIMHHKFAVRDADEIWTGSWNLTVGDTYRLNNNAARMQSAELARAFTEEFETMFVEKKFGAGRARGRVNPPVQVGAMRVQVLFAPEDGVAQRIADRIAQTTGQIRFLAFSFTHDGMGRAVTERARGGVPVSGVFERTGSETRFSEFTSMKQAGLDVYQDGNPYAMHHKVFVLDGRTTIFGSFNFSDGADRENDENALIVDDPGLAGQYLAEVERMLALARNPASARATPERERPR
jgi:phosphatidylserine/phosphatidylglycerophosphate/cardiolipin synthase-like enzyme